MIITCSCLFLQPGGIKLAIDSSWVTEIYYDLDLLLTNFIFFVIYIQMSHTIRFSQTFQSQLQCIFILQGKIQANECCFDNTIKCPFVSIGKENHRKSVTFSSSMLTAEPSNRSISTDKIATSLQKSKTIHSAGPTENEKALQKKVKPCKLIINHPLTLKMT